jgi:hypothetical protein
MQHQQRQMQMQKQKTTSGACRPCGSVVCYRGEPHAPRLAAAGRSCAARKKEHGSLQSGGMPTSASGSCSAHRSLVLPHATPSPSVPQRVVALLVARGMGSHGGMLGHAQVGQLEYVCSDVTTTRSAYPM